ncbi:MAG TPA: hypothetical protein PKD31_23565 [Blastocatellia bacterium]|nr:hypothetical protein [Blastocatellia bacterium]HNG28152.1 hypothetical protein [Blastocatellia bacterium]
MFIVVAHIQKTFVINQTQPNTFEKTVSAKHISRKGVVFGKAGENVEFIACHG